MGAGIAATASRKRRPNSVNIFCIEGDWWGSLEDEKSSSVTPLFDLVAQMHQRLKYIHRPVATRGELEHYLRVWGQARHAKYPVLYLAFHGSPGVLHVGDRRRSESQISLDELAGLLAGKCKNRVVHCGSCSTVRVDRRHLKRFLSVTGASAICGYTESVDWLEASAFEVQLLSEFQGRSMGINGARGIGGRLGGLSPALQRRLGFRYVVA